MGLAFNPQLPAQRLDPFAHSLNPIAAVWNGRVDLKADAIVADE
jgi:hypothetical protein